MASETNGLVTKRDLEEALFRAQNSILERVQEMVRDAQTEILRGFERFSRGYDVRMRKLEADMSNMDTSATLRLAQLEERVLLLEMKIMKQ